MWALIAAISLGTSVLSGVHVLTHVHHDESAHRHAPHDQHDEHHDTDQPGDSPERCETCLALIAVLNQGATLDAAPILILDDISRVPAVERAGRADSLALTRVRSRGPPAA